MFTVVLIGSIVGFSGAALGSVGGVGGGGNACLDHWFDPKSSTAISKYRTEVLYAILLVMQPMLMLGISIGVAFNVMFANWMVTVLLIILFLVTAAKALMKGIETWKKETMMKKEAEKQLESESKPFEIVLSCADGSGEDYKLLPSGPASLPDEQVPISHNDDNVYWKELLMIVYVWVAFLIVQIVKSPLRSLKPNSYAKDQGDCVQRKGNHKLEVASDFSVLQLWDSSWYSSTQDKIHSILFVSQKILSRNPWQGKITEEVWIQNSLIIGFDPKSSTAISKSNAHAGHQHRSGLQRHVRRLDGYSSTYYSLLRYSSKSFNKGHRNMEERDNDEEESRKAVGIRVQTWRFLRLNYCICEEEGTYDVDGWLDAWKAALPKDLEQQKSAHLLH
ncbi:unnamed protein product [Prunus armeniaca]